MACSCSALKDQLAKEHPNEFFDAMSVVAREYVDPEDEEDDEDYVAMNYGRATAAAAADAAKDPDSGEKTADDGNGDKATPSAGSPELAGDTAATDPDVSGASSSAYESFPGSGD